MSTKFFTNQQNNSLFNKFKGIFDNNTIQCFDALVGYFRATGYFKFRQLIGRDLPSIRILVGINTDKTIASIQQKSQQIALDFSNKANVENIAQFWDKVREDIAQASYDKETEENIFQFFQDAVAGHIQIKACTEQKVHSKIYIFRPTNFNKHTPAFVITGSSNFTEAGLGIGQNFNYEFNVQLSDYDDVQFATDEFENLWSQATDILPTDSNGKQQFIKNIQAQTHLNDSLTPFELYIKLLHKYFGETINDNSDFLDGMENFKKLSYQIDAVNEGFNMLLKHNGFILADVVGLGKTVIATMIAKKFSIRNHKTQTRILVICPPAIRSNWENTFKQFQLTPITSFISNGSLERVTNREREDRLQSEPEEYDLVIVDEAHNFRHSSTNRFNQLQKICKTPRRNHHDGIAGVDKKIILVSATPLNNRPDDIYSLLHLFQDSNQSTLPVSNLRAFFEPLSKAFHELKKKEQLSPADIEAVRNIYQKIRKNVVEPVTIRRTRTDINNIPEYAQDLQEQGIQFPTVKPPQELKYAMNTALGSLFWETIRQLTDENGLHYARYQAIAALLPEKQTAFENAETISKSLAAIMKTMLVKRLESSFEAFKSSLNRFQTATQNMITMFEKGKIIIAPDLNVNQLLADGKSFEEIEQEVNERSIDNPKNAVFAPADFKPEFIKQLRKDFEILDKLCTDWQAYDQASDPKLLKFFELFALGRFFSPKIENPSNKLVIFTEAKDTAQYLYQFLKDKFEREDILCISSENRSDSFATILANFDANLPTEKQKDDYKIIITTEVLAEGVNLHRANVIIHYDIPWNSTKLMQRIGRVNRIGSTAPFIYNYVFYPSDQGNLEGGLHNNAFLKIQGFHSAFGEDNQIYSQSEVLDKAQLFSPNALKEQANPLLPYFHFLRRYQKEHKNDFERIANLPDRCRVGRQSTNLLNANLTVAFLKTNRKFEFYRITDQQAEPITDLEAIQLFEAKQAEKPTQLISNHYQHIDQAIQAFRQSLQQAAQTQAQEIGKAAQHAVNFLHNLTDPQGKYNYNPKQILLPQMNNLINLLQKGRYNDLPPKLEKLRKKVSAAIGKVSDFTPIWQPELEAIIQHYHADQAPSAKPAQTIQTETIQLLISESFS